LLTVFFLGALQELIRHAHVDGPAAAAAKPAAKQAIAA